MFSSKFLLCAKLYTALTKLLSSGGHNFSFSIPYIYWDRLKLSVGKQIILIPK